MKRRDEQLPEAPDPAQPPDLGEIVAARRGDPPKSPGKTADLPALKREFADASHWDGLAARYLPHHDLPTWDRRATAETLGAWLERMDLPERAFLRMGAYRDLQDAIDLNPTWPLRALIGLMLEVRAER